MEHSQLRLTEERYDNLIAYPEGGWDMRTMSCREEQFAWIVKHHAAVMALQPCDFEEEHADKFTRDVGGKRGGSVRRATKAVYVGRYRRPTR